MVLTHVVDTSVITRIAQPQVAEQVRGLLRSRSLACTQRSMSSRDFERIAKVTGQSAGVGGRAWLDRLSANGNRLSWHE